MSDLAVRVKGLDDLSRTLRTAGPDVAKQLQRAHLEVSQLVAARAATNVAGEHVARSERGSGGVRGRARANRASIVLLASNPYVRAAVFGTTWHFSWGHPVPETSLARRVWQQWIGTEWNAETDLYGVSSALRSTMPAVLDTYADRVVQALNRAFPD